jgi:ABC-type sugar transport system substrate-binding protein
MRSFISATVAVITLFATTADAADDGVTVAVFTKNLTNPAYEAFRIATEHSQIDAVLSANDSMALGLLEALKAASRSSIVVGINGILPVVKQIETGAILATVDFNM